MVFLDKGPPRFPPFNLQVWDQEEHVSWNTSAFKNTLYVVELSIFSCEQLAMPPCDVCPPTLIFYVCPPSWQCRPPTGRATRRSLSRWHPSRSPVARMTPLTGEEVIDGSSQLSNMIWTVNLQALLLLLEPALHPEGVVLRRANQLRLAKLKTSGWDFLQVCQTFTENLTMIILASLTASPPESESAIWEDAGLPHFAGLFFGIIFLLVLLTYIAKNFQQKKPKTSTISELDRWFISSWNLINLNDQAT